MTFPAPTGETLYHLLIGDSEFLEKAKESIKGKSPDRYQATGKKGSPVNDRLIADVLFKEENTAVRRKIIGPITKEDFLGEMQKVANKALSRIEELGEILIYKSFPETYFHPVGAPALVKSGKLTNVDKEVILNRVRETGVVMLHKDTRFLSTALLVGLSHSLKRSTYVKAGDYTESTVSYTLLTFSYFLAKASTVPDADWFFYWKVFGSLMGLPLSVLPADLETAKNLMKETRKDCYPAAKLTPDQTNLLESFFRAFEEEDGSNEAMEKYISNYSKEGNPEPKFTELCSKRMAQYMFDTGRVGKNKKDSKK